MNINKKLSQNGEHETAAGIDLFKSSNTGDLTYKTQYGKEVVIADKAFVEESMQKVMADVKDGFVLDFKKGSEIIIDDNGNTIVDDSSTNLIYIPGEVTPSEWKYSIENFSGMLIVNDHYSGRVETWIAGGGDAVLLGATIAGGSPSKSTLTMNGGGYDWTNIDGLYGPFTFTVVKTRQGS